MSTDIHAIPPTESIACTNPHVRYATGIAFFLLGMEVSVWGALIPYVKGNIAVDEAFFGLLLLCLGLGALIGMPFAPALASRFGCRKILTPSIILVFMILLTVSLVDTPWQCAILLLLCGMFIGIIDVIINIQAIFIQSEVGKPLMSGVHGLYSIGSISGALIMIALLGFGLRPVHAALILCIAVTSIIIFYCNAYFLPYGNKSKNKKSFTMPKGIVILIGILCFVLYMNEGVILDWSGLFLTTEQNIATSYASSGFAVFATATALVRLIGDKVILYYGAKRILLYGAIIGCIGYAVVLFSSTVWLSLLGFALVGIGTANFIPQLFSLADTQKVMPVHLAIASITMIGFSGVLIGPALMGGVAEIAGLSAIFAVMVTLILLVALGTTFLFRSK